MNHVTDGGSILRAPTQAIVNPVNCVGVMGKGLAKQFSNAYPDMVDDYREACRDGSLRLGQPVIHWVGGDQWPNIVVSFPTKDHWRHSSMLGPIIRGLHALHTTLTKEGVESVAIPALGCGLGGLEWADVLAAIEAEFSDSPLEVWVYHPQEGA